MFVDWVMGEAEGGEAWERAKETVDKGPGADTVVGDVEVLKAWGEARDFG